MLPFRPTSEGQLVNEWRVRLPQSDPSPYTDYCPNRAKTSDSHTATDRRESTHNSALHDYSKGHFFFVDL